MQKLVGNRIFGHSSGTTAHVAALSAMLDTGELARVVQHCSFCAEEVCGFTTFWRACNPQPSWEICNIRVQSVGGPA